MPRHRSLARVRTPLLLALVAVALVPAAASGAHVLRGFVISNGGAPTGSATRRLLGTAGQPAVGASAGTLHRLALGFWSFGGSRVVSVDDDPPLADLPAMLAWGRVFPNPARADVRFAVELPERAHVDLRVLDVQGRLVRFVARRAFEPGFLTIGWDGRDESGRRVRAGVYFARLEVGDRLVGTRRIVIRD